MKSSHIRGTSFVFFSGHLDLVLGIGWCWFRSTKVFRDCGGGSKVIGYNEALAAVRLLGLGFLCKVKNMTGSKRNLHQQGHIFQV